MLLLFYDPKPEYKTGMPIRLQGLASLQRKRYEIKKLPQHQAMQRQ